MVLALPRPELHAAGVAAAGEDGQQVLPERGDLAGDARLRAVAHGHHGHDGGDADDDAQRGEGGAHFVAAQGAQGDQGGLPGSDQQQFRMKLNIGSGEFGFLLRLVERRRFLRGEAAAFVPAVADDLGRRA